MTSEIRNILRLGGVGSVRLTLVWRDTWLSLHHVVLARALLSKVRIEPIEDLTVFGFLLHLCILISLVIDYRLMT